MRRRDLGVLAAALLGGGSGPAPPKRLALVIGNSAYEYADPLPNAVADARIIAGKLRNLGFAVADGTEDLSREGFRKVLTDFSRELRSSGSNIISFVYYSGHAAQDLFGVNYFIPVDIEAKGPDFVRDKGVAIPPLFEAMEAANNDVNIFVLDACRDWFRRDRRPRVPKGLRDMGLHGSVFIAYATRAGSTADEGAGAVSSPFSRRLIEALEKQSSEPIALVFDDVQSKVYADTDSLQLPMYVNGLVRAGRWALSSGALAQVRDTPRPAITTLEYSEFLKSLNRENLITFTRGNVSFVDVLLKRIDLLEKYEINTAIRLAFFLAAIAFETGGFQVQVEKFGYSAAGLRRVFPSVVKSNEIAERLAGKPEEIANFVYANRFGNGPPESGDGWRYRGRSLFFITGRGNYRRYGEEVGADLINAPDLANDLETGIAIAGALWRNQKVNVAADRGDMADAARRFRGAGSSDLPARMIWLTQAKRALGMSQ